MVPITMAFCRSFSASCCRANRAIIYSKNGNPSSVLSALTYPPLSPPTPNTVNIKFLLSPINPADINVIEGVYPLKPSPTTLAASGNGSQYHPVFVPGNEGLAQIMDVGAGVSSLQKNDWVVMGKQQMGTWSSSKNVAVDDVLRVPRADALSEVFAATMTVNPPTAYNMLHDFIPLQRGDWVLQNGANSAVGQIVIQIAASKDVKTINFIRNRNDLQSLVTDLKGLGATKVLTYDDLSDKTLRNRVKEWTGGKDIRLGLNCVGGRETTLMAYLLGQDAHLVSNLTSHGFWQSRWYADRTRKEQETLLQAIVKLKSRSQLKEPEHEIVTIGGTESDEDAARKVGSIIAKMSEGRYGKKVLLKIEGPQ